MTGLLSILMAAALFPAVLANAASVVEHTFHVGTKTVRRLGRERDIIAVNGRFPGPPIIAHEGDTVIVHVLNMSPYNMSIHWHGVFQRLSAWSDGPTYVTQCPIRPGHNFTYKYKVAEQEGTLWYHAHVSFLRATLYGAIIILPSPAPRGYPFAKPYRQLPTLLLGEWWNENEVDVEAAALAAGGTPVHADAFTINGTPGHLYPSPQNGMMFKIKNVLKGKTYLLRIVNAALNAQFFFKVGGHNMTVVAADASYTVPYTTGMLVLAPGQTIDALLHADAPPSTYYIVASQYFSSAGLPVPNIPATTGLLCYRRRSRSNNRPAVVPSMPGPRDTEAAHGFYSALTGLVRDGDPRVPIEVDERMLVTIGLGLMPCGEDQTCGPPFPGMQVVGSMNNVSFELPETQSLLEAWYRGDGSGESVMTWDFPNRPAVEFDYVNPRGEGLCMTTKGTRVKKLRYGARVEVVLQNTGFVGVENHPIHLHGFNFFVVAQGFGNYADSSREMNLVNPQVRNTVAVPAGGWAVIRFLADNPGIWIMHCHLDLHMMLGLGTAFIVEDGPTVSSSLPPPPPNLPRC